MIEDRHGQEIKPGTVVTYPGRQGSNLWIQDAIVTAVDEKNRAVSVDVPSDTGFHMDGTYKRLFRKTAVVCLDRLTVLPHIDADKFKANWLKGDRND